MIDSLKIELNDYAVNSSLPGFAVGLVNKDGVIYTAGFGFSDIKKMKNLMQHIIQGLLTRSDLSSLLNKIHIG